MHDYSTEFRPSAVITSPMTFYDKKPANPKNGDVVVTPHSTETLLYVDGKWEDLGTAYNFYEQPAFNKKAFIPTNCCNCGAPLRGMLHCSYCGTTNVEIILE